ncbi:unnamed protein product [Scytosiphon promiscuus]
MPWVYRSSSSGFQERVSGTTREKIQVGEELRYPATLTAAEGGAEISLGVDGRLLHAPEARAAWIHENILAATAMIAANTPKGPFTRRRVDRAQLSLSLGDIDEDKARTLKTLFTPSAEASAALLRDFARGKEELERAGEGGGIRPDSASAGAVMKEGTSTREPSPTVPDGVSGTGTGTGDKRNQADLAKTVHEDLPLPSPRGYGNDVVLWRGLRQRKSDRDGGGEDNAGGRQPLNHQTSARLGGEAGDYLSLR